MEWTFPTWWKNNVTEGGVYETSSIAKTSVATNTKKAQTLLKRATLRNKYYVAIVQGAVISTDMTQSHEQSDLKSITH